ncbi:MAG: hypothetical protein ACE5GB_09150, partial [Acidimicrobiales bacterium]
MSSVGLVVHLRRPEAGSLAAELAGWLQAAGHTVRVPEAEAAIEGLAPVAVENSSVVEGLDLVV